MKIERILLPTDFSECSQHALEYALLLREKLGAKITLLHVWEVPQGIGLESMAFIATSSGDSVTLMEYLRGQAEKSLAELVAKLKRRGVEVDSKLAPGSAALTILEHQKGFDLLVMGTHGRGAIAHFLLGSVAERVVRKATVPVLTIRVPELPSAASRDGAGRRS